MFEFILSRKDGEGSGAHMHSASGRQILALRARINSKLGSERVQDVLAHQRRDHMRVQLAAMFVALAIQDNSFLVEEAYNQEPRVVQHIFGMTRDADHRWTGTFTQEWPAGGVEHQI